MWIMFHTSVRRGERMNRISLAAYSAQAIDARSPHTAGHSMRVNRMVVKQAEAINRVQEGPFAAVHFSEDEMNELHMASWLHDIGKIGVREYVLDKVNKLSDDNIAAIVTRFDYIKLAYRNHAIERKLFMTTGGTYSPEEMEEIDQQTELDIAKLDDDHSCDAFFNISQDPKFTDDGYHLSSDSPCIGAGTAKDAPEFDLLGITRHNPPDMGAYEFDRPVSVKEEVPTQFILFPNYPNPFNPSTTISFSLPKENRVELAIYSISGQRVRTLLSGRMSAGTYSSVWDGRDD